MSNAAVQMNRRNIIIGLLMAIALSAIEVTIVSTAMPTIVRELGDIHLMNWVFAIYLLANAVTTPVYGKLADIVGRKKIFLIGTALFLLGSSLCGLAQTMEQLIFFRAIQGTGAGALFPVSLTIIGDLFSIEERARIQGLLSAVWFVAGILGPLLGGIIVDWLSWQWIFYVNIPFGILSVLLIRFCLHEQFEKKRHHIDYRGAITFTIGMTCLLYPLMVGGKNNDWGSPVILSLFAAAVVFLSLFYVIELKAAEPMLPLNLFKMHLVVIPNLATFFLCTVLIGLNAYLPLWVQGVLGYRAFASGIALAPMSIGWTAGAVWCGKLLIKAGVRKTTVTGAVLIPAGCSLLSIMSCTTPAWFLFLSVLVIGLGFGLAMTSFGIVIQSSVEWGLRGSATALFSFVQALGQTVGIAVLGMWFNSAVKNTAGNELSRDVLALGLHYIFVALIVIAALGLLVTLRVPSQKPAAAGHPDT